MSALELPMLDMFINGALRSCRCLDAMSGHEVFQQKHRNVVIGTYCLFAVDVERYVFSLLLPSP